MSVAASYLPGPAVTKGYGPAPRRRRRFLHHRAGEIVGGQTARGRALDLSRDLRAILAPSSSATAVSRGYDVMADSIEVRRVISYVPEDLLVDDQMWLSSFCVHGKHLKGLRGRRLRQAVVAAAERLDLTDVSM